MKEELTTAMHADFLAEDGWTRFDVKVLGAYSKILNGEAKAEACKKQGITVEQYDANIERVKRL